MEISWPTSARRTCARQVNGLPPHSGLSIGKLKKTWTTSGGSGAECQARSSLVQEMGQGIRAQLSTFKWYLGGTTNICYSAVDFKVKMGKGAKAAFIFEAGGHGRSQDGHLYPVAEYCQEYAAPCAAWVSEGRPHCHLYAHEHRGRGHDAACVRIGAVHVASSPAFPRGDCDRVELSGPNM